MRRRSSFRRGSSNRRKLVWSYATGALSFTAAELAVFDLLSPLRVAGASVLGCTVMRTHIRLANQAASITRGDSLAWGLIVGESQDVGTPAPAGAPDPNGETMLDWAMITRHFATISGGALAAAGQATYFDQNNNSMLFDIKAKRKIQEMNQSWHLCMNQIALGTAGNASWQFQTRVLLALP